MKSVQIVGGGLIGLAIARELAIDHKVRLFDSPRKTMASRVGAGLLIPVGGRISRHHFALKKASADLYPNYVAELERETGATCGYRACGTLTVAYEPGAGNAINGLAGCVRGFGVEPGMLTAEECVKVEPGLGSDIGCGFLTDDAQVDPGALLSCLRTACEQRGVEFVEAGVTAVSDAYITDDQKRDWSSDTVIVCAGAWLRRLIPDLEVYPVKGEVIGLITPEDTVRHNIVVQRESLYVANRAGNRLVVGATEEEKGFCERQTAKESLWEQACRLLPALASCEVEWARVGFRPKVGDGLPLMGEYNGVLIAGAHYRNGILLTPITAKLMGELVRTGEVSALIQPYLPTRDIRNRN